ncbi:unnamed protein product [Periconia digitata]|uniref:non-specific serine/threonine protein kinase n=1 Tax=Periconia digitata TaxID=1303443 RepID=A0A9W4U7X4_9PLEO|nr:unnamed protein product [Periconia digitata]
MNGGIFLVRDAKTKKEYIEKRGGRREIENGLVEQEILILKFLSCPPHPHINSIVDHYVDRKASKASLYLRRCSEGGLNSFIKKRRENQAELFNEIDVWEWFIQVFDALTYCHYGNSEKRASKDDYHDGWNMPANILVTKGTPKGQTTAYTFQLADFGCAVQRSSVYRDRNKDRATTSFMTAGWQPPESPRFTARSDVWQLGAVMACICNLVNLPTQFDMKDPAPGYSKQLNETIQGCLIPDPSTRPKSYEVLAWCKQQYENLREELNTSGSPNPSTLPQRSPPVNTLRQLRPAAGNAAGISLPTVPIQGRVESGGGLAGGNVNRRRRRR